MAGMQVFVTLPGIKRQPIFVDINATVAQFTRAVYNATGVALFNGFGFVGQASDGTITARYLVPTSAKVTGTTGDEMAAVTGVWDLTNLPALVQTLTTGGIANAIESVSNGTETLISALGITTGVEVIFFATGDTTLVADANGQNSIQTAVRKQQAANQ